MGRLLGREPVMTISTIVALLIAVLPAFGWSTETVGAVAAALLAIGGALEAALVSVDRLLPLLVGLGKAVLAAVASFGVHLADNHVAAIMAVLTVFAGLQVRKQVGAVQPPRDRDGNQVGPIHGQIVEFDATRADLAGTETPGMRPPDTGRMRLMTSEEIATLRGDTEVFGAIAADGPVPEDKSGRHHRDHQSARRQRGGLFNGDLGTELAT